MAFNRMAFNNGEPQIDEVGEDDSLIGEIQNLYPVRYRGRNTLEELRAAGDQDSAGAVGSIVTGPGFDRYWGSCFRLFHYFRFCSEHDISVSTGGVTD